jgi:CDP-6-deoxy-D-xylo-4-hexulose-3-dehydrase
VPSRLRRPLLLREFNQKLKRIKAASSERDDRRRYDRPKPGIVSGFGSQRFKPEAVAEISALKSEREYRVNIDEVKELIEPVNRLLAVASRANMAKPIKYWYPLSLATYGLEEILEAIDSMCSFRTSMWEKTAAFEAEFARHIGCGEAVMVNSGSSADLLLAFSLIDPGNPRLRPKDEVLVPAVTWPTQIWSVLMAGLQPVLVDIDPATLNMDFDKAEEVITERTKAIFLVHLMGNPCDMDRAKALCEKYDLLLLEDACEALGATYRDRRLGAGGWGGSFSFFFSHHITTMEGGMIVCNDPELADRFRALRAHGWVRDQHNKQSLHF